jgi:hypothetical protein
MRRLRRSVWHAVAAVADALGPSVRAVVWTEVEQLRRGLRWTVGWNVMLARAMVRDRLSRRRHPKPSESALRASRRSETVFVFGSGASLNDIGRDEWEHFRRHDVLGFNTFYKERWVPVDFQLLRGGVYEELRWRPHAEEVASELAANPLYERTTYVVQEGFLAQHGNQLVGYGLLPRGAPVLRYRSVSGWGPPTRSLSDGLRHVVGTLDDAVNLGYCLGWKEIVLVGVDLYDSRYFWLPLDQTIAVDSATGGIRGHGVGLNGQGADQPHNTAANGVVRLMAEWREALAEDGVRLYVYNPRSLLAEVLPVYERVAAGPDQA